MCGIAAAYGINGAPALALKICLEHASRGRDATGVTWSKDGKLFTLKKAIAPSDYNTKFLKDLEKQKVAQFAIAHNRAATCNLQEKTMDKECHPFLSEDHSFALLQNGTVPFADHMGAYLEVLGHKFSSGIDSEILLHMLEDIMARSKDRADAFTKFWRASIGNIIVLFADGELWGIADTMSFNAIIDRGNGAIYIASEMDSLVNALKDVLTDKAEGFDTKGGTAIRLFYSKEKGVTYLAHGDWNKGLIKDGEYTYNKTTMCDFCHKSAVRCEEFKVGLLTKDRCYDCFKAKVTTLPITQYNNRYADHLSETHTVTQRCANENTGTNNSEKLNVICSKCHLPHDNADSIICSDCNKTFCTYCFTRHQCKDEVVEPSQNIIKWLYNMITVDTVSEGY